jgi:hypothetical protein
MVRLGTIVLRPERDVMKKELIYLGTVPVLAFIPAETVVYKVLRYEEQGPSTIQAVSFIVA